MADEFDGAEVQELPPGGGLAISAFVLGILGLVFFPLALAALILGIIGATKPRYRGMAIGGVIFGVVGLIIPVLFLLGFFLPFMHTSRMPGNESYAALGLRSGVFPAQIQFSAAAYVDLDGDGRGEYGFLPWLSDQQPYPTPEGEEPVILTLLGAEFAGPDAEVMGYHFQLFMPDAQGGAVDLQQARAMIAAGDLSAVDAWEKHFIVYAWPAELGSTGRKVFVMTQEGRVLTHEGEYDGPLPPPWHQAIDRDAKTDAGIQHFRSIKPGWREYR